MDQSDPPRWHSGVRPQNPPGGRGYAGCCHRNVCMESAGATSSMTPTVGSEIPKETGEGDLGGGKSEAKRS